MECRSNCGACCIAPSIHTAIPNMPNGKKAGEYCNNLDPVTFQCSIWGKENYPKLCGNFQACSEICGESRDEALINITHLELATR
jgi:hypothetical protein